MPSNPHFRIQETIERVEHWSTHICGSLVRWELRALLVVVLLGFMTSLATCAYGTLGAKRRVATSRSGWNSAIIALGKSGIGSVPASFKDAGVGAARVDGRRRNSEPDVGDACAVM